MGLWRTLSDFGEHHYDDPRDRKLNIISNQLLLFFIFALMIVFAMTGTILYIAILEDPVKYKDYFLVYFGTDSLVFLAVIASYILKVVYGIHHFVQLAYYAGLLFIPLLSAFLGKEAGLHMYLLALLPLPYFALHPKNKKLLITSQIMIPILFGATIWYLENYPALYPLPEMANSVVYVTWIIMLVLSLSFCAYYLWRQTNLTEDLYVAEKETVERVNRELREKDEAMQLELELAGEVQKNIFPKALPHFDHLKVELIFLPMGRVSGDYYDFYQKEKTLSILSADVSGHGVPAALITMVLKRTFDQLYKESDSPARVFEKANSELLQHIETEDYLTAFLAEFTESGEVRYCNGGHRPPLLYRKKTSEFEQLDTRGFPVGAIEEASALYENKTTSLGAGDRLIIYTDGIIEQRNRHNKEFGLEHMQDIIHQRREEPLIELCASLTSALHSFRGSRAISDDITLIAIERPG